MLRLSWTGRRLQIASKTIERSPRASALEIYSFRGEWIFNNLSYALSLLYLLV